MVCPTVVRHGQIKSAISVVGLTRQLQVSHMVMHETASEFPVCEILLGDHARPPTWWNAPAFAALTAFAAGDIVPGECSCESVNLQSGCW